MSSKISKSSAAKTPKASELKSNTFIGFASGGVYKNNHCYFFKHTGDINEMYEKCKTMMGYNVGLKYAITSNIDVHYDRVCEKMAGRKAGDNIYVETITNLSTYIREATGNKLSSIVNKIVVPNSKTIVRIKKGMDGDSTDDESPKKSKKSPAPKEGKKFKLDDAKSEKKIKLPTDSESETDSDIPIKKLPSATKNNDTVRELTSSAFLRKDADKKEEKTPKKKNHGDDKEDKKKTVTFSNNKKEDPKKKPIIAFSDNDDSDDGNVETCKSELSSDDD